MGDGPPDMEPTMTQSLTDNEMQDLMDLIAPTTKAKVTAVNNVRTINDISGMDVVELLALRDEIDEHLPAKRLEDVNLAEELVLQFQKIKVLQTKTLDSNTSAQQKAAVANACASSLQQLVRMQTELHTAERLKAIEQALIHVMRDQPEALQLAFFERYEKLLAV